MIGTASNLGMPVIPDTSGGQGTNSNQGRNTSLRMNGNQGTNNNTVTKGTTGKGE